MIETSRKQPVYVLGGLLYALPVALSEALLLVMDGPWWLPHPAGAPAVSVVPAALTVVAMVTLLFTHAVALRLPEGLTWDEFWGSYVAALQVFGAVATVGLIIAMEWYGLRQFLALAVPLGVVAFHASSLMAARK